MPNEPSPLDLFHPLVADWFRQRIGAPTDVQSQAWPRIAAGDHVLVTAPTGSGKTLTAFLWALNSLITGRYPVERCSVLYVSPLRALNNDIQRNLLGPLEELRRLFRRHGEEFPRLRVLTRSGDTPPEERRRMSRHPPEILITTPESLNLLLSSHSGIPLLAALRTVVLDEIHGVVDSKRGVHLITAVERLVPLSGEFQRIALSATVQPLELVAQFVGGYQRLPDGTYQPRSVTIVTSAARKAYDLRVRVPKRDGEAMGQDPFWLPIINECRQVIARNRSTLVFTNSRRLAENITWKINDREGRLLAYAHHGSLSREIRTEVERKLKAGELRAIVATNSLEMGIDIGALDEVVLVQCPPRISSAIQRVGRAGHRVGETSRATLFPSHAHDLLEAAVLARSILEHDIEALRAVHCPLDVLAQVLISMTGLATRDADELYNEIRCSYPYRQLSRRQFDLVLDMLAGRYAEARVRGLKARLSVDRLDNTVAARPGALQDLYVSGGTIPDRGYLHVRDLRTNALIGELDEEFVWEASPGQAMAFAAQTWRIERITHNDVFVVPTGPTAQDAPFWRGEEWSRDAHFSERIAAFLEDADAALDTPAFRDRLREFHCLDDRAADELVGYLRRQKESCGGRLPHRHHVVVEHVTTGPGRVPATQVIIHTFWGGTVNRPFAMALSAAWQDRFGAKPEVYPGNDAVHVIMTDDIDSAELLSLVTTHNLEELLRRSLEGSGFFGARFRECAGRALLITRMRRNERMPLWVTRLRAKALLEAVLGYEDFPVLLETWRTCLQDEFEMPVLHARLAELESGAITWSEVRHDHLSPFAAVMSWRQTNRYMYADDTPVGRTVSQLRADLLREVALTPALRPQLTPDLVSRFVSKRQRLAPGYAPQTPRELVDWVKERLLIPASEWEELLQAMVRDGVEDLDATLLRAADKLVWLSPPDTHVADQDGRPRRDGDVGPARDHDERPAQEGGRRLTRLVAAAEDVRRLAPIWGGPITVAPLADAAAAPITVRSEADDERLGAILAEWLRFYGPVSPQFIATTLALPSNRVAPCLQDLLDTETVIQGPLVEGGSETDVCDSRNFETLLRLARAAAVPSFEPRPARELPLFLACYQGLCAPGASSEDLWAAMQRLSGYEARAELWEEAILPARLRQYRPEMLDSLLQEGRLLWLGAARRRVSFCLSEDLDLVRASAPRALPEALRHLLHDPDARYTLRALQSRSDQRPEVLVDAIWEAVWSGALTSDTFAAVRRGISSDFRAPALPETADAPRRIRRRLVWRRATQRGTLMYPGTWFRVPEPEPVEGPLEIEEQAKDRVRLLLDRYGLLFRELLVHETAPLRWPAVFRALRLMELSGEVLGGRFFEGIPGLQFIAPHALRRLQHELPDDAIWWINACDPASLCGIGPEVLKADLPRRVPGNYVVYGGAEILLVVLREGAELQFRIPPDDPRLPRCLGPLHNLLERAFRPLHRVVVQTVNGKPAAASAYREPLCAPFDALLDMDRLILRRRVH